jgi:hypothetical protein
MVGLLHLQAATEVISSYKKSQVHCFFSAQMGFIIHVPCVRVGHAAPCKHSD